MRQINSKGKRVNRGSKFFDYFINKTNESIGTSSSSVVEIQERMKMFFIDLVKGNLSPKYINYLITDPRIIQEAIPMCEQKLLDLMCYKDAMQIAAVENSPMANTVKMNPHFNACLREIAEKVSIYSMIYEALITYRNSGVMNDGLVHLERCQPEILYVLAAKFRANQYTKSITKLMF